MSEKLHNDRADSISFKDFIELLSAFWENGEIPDDVQKLCSLLHTRLLQCMNSDTGEPAQMMEQSENLRWVALWVRELSSAYFQMAREIFLKADEICKAQEKERSKPENDEDSVVYSSGTQLGDAGTALSGDGTLCVSVNLYAKSNGLTNTTLRNHLERAGIQPKGSAVPVGGQRPVPIYDLLEVERLPYVQAELDPERLLDPCQCVVIRGKHIMSDKAFSALHGIGLRVLRKEIKLNAVKVERRFTREKITAYGVQELNVLPYVQKESKLATIDPMTGEVIVGDVPYVHRGIFSNLHRLEWWRLSHELGDKTIPHAYALLNREVKIVIPRRLIERTKCYQAVQEIKKSFPLLTRDADAVIGGTPCTTIDFFYHQYLDKNKFSGWDYLLRELRRAASNRKFPVAGRAYVDWLDKLDVVDVYRRSDLEAIVNRLREEEAERDAEALESPLELGERMRDHHHRSGTFRLSNEKK